MSKSLKSMGVTEKNEAIARRIMENKGGLGYWSAVEAQKKRGKVSVSQSSSTEEPSVEKKKDPAKES